MQHQTQALTIGERLVRAAHLAVAAHLGQSIATQDHSGRRIVIGGAGPAWFKDEPASSLVDPPRSEGSTLTAEGGPE